MKKEDNLYHGSNNKIIDNPSLFWEEFKNQLYNFLEEIVIKQYKNIGLKKYSKIIGCQMLLVKLVYLYNPSCIIAIADRDTLNNIIDYFNFDIKKTSKSLDKAIYIKEKLIELYPQLKNEDSQYITSALWEMFFDEKSYKEHSYNPSINRKKKNTIDDDDADYIIDTQEQDNINSYVKEDNPTPEKRKEPLQSKYKNGKNKYPRDPRIANKALGLTGFKCELLGEDFEDGIKRTHETFKRRKDGSNYTEPHHLVPMSAQDDFENDLDKVQNIVSLCSNCHNEIHYGENARELIEKLYNERKEQLEQIGINITLEKLFEIYGI